MTRCGRSHHLRGCSLTWLEPMSATGFASIQLSWFCFPAMIVFNSNAAEHKEVAALLFSQHWSWLCRATRRAAVMRPATARTLPQRQNFLPFLDRLLAHSSPEQNSQCPEGGSSSPHIPSSPSCGCSPRLCSLGLLSQCWTTMSSHGTDLIWTDVGPALPSCCVSQCTCLWAALVLLLF